MSYYFMDLEIKYFVRDKGLQQFFLKQYGKATFNPYLLEGNQIDEFISLLAGSEYQDLAAQSHTVEQIRLPSKIASLMAKRYTIGFVVLAALIIIALLFEVAHYLG